MKNTIRFFAFIFTFILSTGANALEDPITTGNIIEFGAGATKTSGPTVDLLFHIQGQKTIGMGKEGTTQGYFILARIQGDLATSGKKITFADIEFQGLGAGTRWDAEVTRGFLEFNLLSASYHRDLMLDEKQTAQLSFVGIRAGTEVYLKNDLAIYVKGAANILGLAVAERTTDSARVNADSGWVSSAMAEFGLRFRERYRLAFGVKTLSLSGDDRFYATGETVCDYEWVSGEEYCDEFGCYTGEGHYEYQCHTPGYNRNKFASLNQFYAELHADLSRNLSLFAGAGYAVFHMEDGNGDFANSEKAAWRFKLGAIYKF